MNLVLEEAAEVFVKDAKPRRELGEDYSHSIWLSKTLMIDCRSDPPER